jgi:hypothetical protein
MNTLTIQKDTPHYYGDTVRFLFLVAAVIMLLTLPMVSEVLNIPTVISVASILVLGAAAGLTNPKQVWDSAINVFISAAGFLIFETTAVWTYRQHIDTVSAERFFLANIGLGLIFMIALYFSVKTLRGLYNNSDQ